MRARVDGALASIGAALEPGDIGGGTLFGSGPWVDVVDVPLWGLAALFTFRIAAAFRGGALGRAVRWLAWALTVVTSAKIVRGGFLFWDAERLVMSDFGQLLWTLVLASAWGLAGVGIYEFHRAGRSI